MVVNLVCEYTNIQGTPKGFEEFSQGTGWTARVGLANILLAKGRVVNILLQAVFNNQIFINAFTVSYCS